MERYGRADRRKSAAHPTAKEECRRVYGSGANDDERCANRNLTGLYRAYGATVNFDALDTAVAKYPSAVLNRLGQVIDMSPAFFVFGTAQIAWAAGGTGLHVERHR